MKLTDEETLLIQKIKDDLIDIQGNNGDTEVLHVRADNLLCELLEGIGLHDISIEFDKINKWYA